MSTKTNIEWTDATWNPLRGCTAISPGCANCYAAGVAARFAGAGQPYEGLARYDSQGKPHWTGRVAAPPDKLLDPLRWKRPRMVFVNSMSDLFHDTVPERVIDRIVAVMALSGQHVFQVLTKRSRRMAEYLGGRTINERVYQQMEALAEAAGIADFLFDDLPLDNVWWGVSVEDQTRAKRLDSLLEIPDCVRFVSVEPLLSRLDLSRWIPPQGVPAIDWVIVGGESGPNARPCHPDWVRLIRDQCQAAGVSFFFKQWGEWAPVEPIDEASCCVCGCTDDRACEGGCYWIEDPDMLDRCSQCAGLPVPDERPASFERVGKKAAGRLLDGVEWSEFPFGG